MNNYQRPYYPKRPVKSFQDLEVYQKLLAVSVAVIKRTMDDRKLKMVVEDGKSKIEKSDNPSSIFYPQPLSSIVNHLSSNVVEMALKLPLLIAEAHSLRFSEPETAIRKLERVMLGCNQAVVYLEQYRDIENKDIETEFFEEQIKTILATRGQVMRLQFSWKKFMEQKKKE